MEEWLYRIYESDITKISNDDPYMNYEIFDKKIHKKLFIRDVYLKGKDFRKLTTIKPFKRFDITNLYFENFTTVFFRNKNETYQYYNISVNFRFCYFNLPRIHMPKNSVKHNFDHTNIYNEELSNDI